MNDWFTKDSAPAGPEFYPVEAAGLRWLARAGPGSARVVGVRHVQADHIQLERLIPARPSQTAGEQFGRALARTHAAGAAAFGAPPAGWTQDGYIGRQPLRLQPVPTWGRFYAEQRVQPYARRARDLGQLSTAGASAVDRVCERLAAGVFDDDRAPARIHGDLWAGNVVYTASGAVLIDPAAHGGHGLTDLAMLHLFGAPQLEVVTRAYAVAAALDDAWPDLIGLHQLHPLLVHAVSHDASYGAAAERVAQRYV